LLTNNKQRIGRIRQGNSFDWAIIGARREAEMVCAVCNGKGYVIEKHGELVCRECHGRGECFLIDSERHQKQESQKTHEVR